MYPQNFELFAAVGSAQFAWGANAAIHVWIDGAAIANFYTHLVISYLDHLSRQLMPQDARIGEGRVAASQSMEIAATHPDATDSNQRVLSSRLGGRNLPLNQFAGRI